LVRPADAGFAEVGPDTVRMVMFALSSTNLQALRGMIEAGSHRGHGRGEGGGENESELHIGGDGVSTTGQR